MCTSMSNIVFLMFIYEHNFQIFHKNISNKFVEQLLLSMPVYLIPVYKSKLYALLCMYIPDSVSLINFSSYVSDF